MKQSNQGFDYSYNAQAVVDSAAQIIVAAEVTNQANDKQQAVPMAQAVLDNLAAAGIEKPKAADGTPTPIPNTAVVPPWSAARSLLQCSLPASGPVLAALAWQSALSGPHARQKAAACAKSALSRTPSAASDRAGG